MKTVSKKNKARMRAGNKIRMRAGCVGGLFFVLLGVIAARAVQLQVFQGSWLSEKATDQVQRSLTIPAKRGTIYDATHQVMAVSIDTPSVAAYPRRVQNPGRIADALAKALQMSRQALYAKLTADGSFVWIKRQISPKEAEKVRDLNLEGIDFVAEHTRFYPNKSLAAQVLGFSGIDGRGLEGVEFFYDSYLKGEQKKTTVLKDALGRPFESYKQPSIDPQGDYLVLTIDRNIQYMTETALKEAIDQYGGKSAMAVVMAPKTGAILALAQYPFFNPNAFSRFGRDCWRNKAITDPFEPGSTMKIFSAAAALDQGLVSPSSIFYCENGAYRIGKNIIHDTKPHGWLSVQQIVKFSSNIGAVKLAETMGPEVLYTYLSNFGFGRKTGIDCPGETSGNLSNYKRWSAIDTGAIAFGQGISVSAIQLVTAAAAIANDGLLPKPYIVQQVTDPDGRVIQRFEPEPVRRVISIATAHTVQQMMRTVVMEGGTGENAALDGYPVCGKTGTAQKVGEDGGYAKGKYIASFIGFAPAQNPEAVILVVIDEPESRYYGGEVAAPAFKKIANETLHYKNVVPKIGNEELRMAAVEEVKR
jgi:cell division protein FtsI (penicillin-binding protein 3)